MARVREGVLRKVAHRQRIRFHDGARVRLVEPGKHLQQSGLAGAVGAAQTHAFALRDLPRDVVEQDAFAEGLRQGRKLDQDKK